MTRATFDQGLDELQRDTLLLASFVERAVDDAVRSLVEGDRALADAVVAGDDRVNRKRYEIEERAIALLALQQPMAGDLRVVAAVLYIIVDLERIGDHAEGIARIARGLPGVPPEEAVLRMQQMAEIARSMLQDAVESFRRRDVPLARVTCDRDDEVDALHDELCGSLIEKRYDHDGGVAAQLTWVAHNLERIADRATNICERVVYLVEGKIEELNVSKY